VQPLDVFWAPFILLGIEKARIVACRVRSRRSATGTAKPSISLGSRL
jgi:hypothetical protein